MNTADDAAAVDTATPAFNDILNSLLLIMTHSSSFVLAGQRYTGNSVEIVECFNE